MAEVINLNKARKARVQAADQQQAAENRLRFGRSKLQKQRDAAESEAMRRKLDGIRIEPKPES